MNGLTNMNILQVNTRDAGGGADKIALTLHCACREAGIGSWMVVGHKKTDVEGIVQLNAAPYLSGYRRVFHSSAGLLNTWSGRIRGAGRLAGLLESASRPGAMLDGWRGMEDFNYPASQHLLDHVPVAPDLIHLHNLHGGFFDLGILPQLSATVPVVITLHDEWMLAGHCGYTLGCDRWLDGCGNCPNLAIYPSIRRDATAPNWRRKAEIYGASRLHIAAPSEWLMDKVHKSILMRGTVETRVIRNGIDLAVFYPADKRNVRAELGLPQDAHILVFAANGIRRNQFKDFLTMRSALEQLSQSVSGKLLFLAVGESSPSEMMNSAQLCFVPYQSDPKQIAKYYQAADVSIHAALSDNFPTTVLEALACGTPVVATAVGGIAEQIMDGVTGFLTPPSDPRSMAMAVGQLLRDTDLLADMSDAAAEYAARNYDQRRMVEQYVSWYKAILSKAALDAQAENG